MAYSESQINNAVSTVHMNSKRQAKRALVTNYANGDINFIGDCCFAYSGVKDYGGVQHQEYTILDFVNGPNFVKAEFQWLFSEYQSDDTIAMIKFNDVIMMESYFNDPRQNNPYGFNPLKLVIPPFTEVKVIFINKATASAWEVTASMTGKVYTGAEIIQGAI